MTKHTEVHKPRTKGCEQVEEGTTASGKDVRTVGKPTEKAPDMQHVWDITETVTEERVVEEIPPNTWEQVPQHLLMERCKATGESSKCTGEVHQQEVAEQPPLDHESDQDIPKYEEDSAEVNQRADRLEFIREFQEMMDQAIEKLLMYKFLSIHFQYRHH